MNQDLFSPDSEPETEPRGSLPQVSGDMVSAEEQSLRLANLVTPYGVGTRSYNRSAEKHELDRQRAEATAKHESGLRHEYEAALMCPCLQRPYPHDLSVHRQLSSEFWRDKSLRDHWPWSLAKSEKVEAGT